MEDYWQQAKTWETLIRMNCKPSPPVWFPTTRDLWAQISCLVFRRDWPRVVFLGAACQADANIIHVSEWYLTCHWSVGVTGVLWKISFRLKESGIICTVVVVLLAPHLRKNCYSFRAIARRHQSLLLTLLTHHLLSIPSGKEEGGGFWAIMLGFFPKSL